MHDTSRVVVVGAGLSGTLLAILLKRRGFAVSLYEARDDLRRQEAGVHRSINLVLTSRGRFALRSLGLEDEVMKLVVPAVGRCIHNLDGTEVIQPYGKDDNEANYSVSRSGLNIHLLDVAEREGVPIYFNQRLTSADLTRREYTFEGADGSKKTVSTYMCFGADGAASVTRRKLLQHLLDVPITELDTSMKQHYEWGGKGAIKQEVQRLGLSYKELNFPLKADGSKPLDTKYVSPYRTTPHNNQPQLPAYLAQRLPLPDGSRQP